MKKIILISVICAICTNSQSQSWNLTGNSGTTASTNFIGTIDNIPFKIRTKNVVRVTVNSSGKVGIGISSPVFKLDVKGGIINTDSVYRIGGNTVLSVKGTENTFTGINSGFSNNSGNYNTGHGYQSLYNNLTGNNNSANGRQAPYSNVSGHNNTAQGSKALFQNTTGGDNVAIGLQALYSNTTGQGNVAIGRDALYSDSISAYNTAIGNRTLYNNHGHDNTAIGDGTLENNTSGFYNTGCGSGSLFVNSTGVRNTAIGNNALSINTIGNYNTAIGQSADFSTNSLDNTACIGYNSGGFVNSSNRIELGNTSVSVIAWQVSFSTYSDARIKDNVKEDVPGLAFISKLRPVTYNLNIHRENEMGYKGRKKDEADWASKYDIEKIRMTGFLAQDVEKAAKESGYDFSGVQKPSNPDELYSLRYSDFVMPLVKAVQELSEKSKTQDLLIENLKSEINNLKSGLKESENKYFQSEKNIQC